MNKQPPTTNAQPTIEKNPEQITKLMTGNEMVAEAANVIDFHFMGYYPITPSTEIAQILESMKSRGEVNTVLLPADGEHGLKATAQWYRDNRWL